MLKSQIVTITFFRFEKLSARWKALGMMGGARSALSQVEGMSFGKMLGSGGRDGFSIFPNFGVYGILAAWEGEIWAERFFGAHPFFVTLQENATDQWTTYLRTSMVHGEWEGHCPFFKTVDFDPERPVAVLTRATIRTKRLMQFWKYVPGVSRSMDEHREGLLFSVGVGELPLVQQATVSFWQNSRFMQAYAYKSRFHSEVIQKTRELGWYKEELFARFHPYKSTGSWQGENPLSMYFTEPTAKSTDRNE